MTKQPVCGPILRPAITKFRSDRDTAPVRIREPSLRQLDYRSLDTTAASVSFSGLPMHTPAPLDPRRNDAACLLDAVRLVAAQAVLVGHGISFFKVYQTLDYPAAPYMQN